MLTMCLQCKYRVIIEDSNGKYHSICTCCESENFLEEVLAVFERCDYGELEFDEDEESEGEG